MTAVQDVQDVLAGSRVTVVTVLQDRAQVTRVAEVELPAGVARVRLEDVAPVLVDATLTATVDGGVTVHDARVERRWVALDAERPDEVAELDARIATADDELNRLVAQRDALNEAVTAASEAARLTLLDLAADAGRGRFDAAEWHDARERLDTAEAERRDALVAAQDLVMHTDQQLADLRARRAALDSPATRVAAAIVVDLAGPGGPATLTLTYVVASALWRPAHRARLDGDQVEVATDAVVWQRTGEAWPDVELACSTAQPSLGSEPPALPTDHLSAQRSAGIVVEVREEDVQTTGLGADPTVADVPAVDDGGEVRVLRPAGRVTVPSDGLPHRLPVATSAAASTASLVAVPELAEAVVLRTEQAHPGPGPLLAGPVELLRDHGIAGRTSTRFIAPGERWALAWGPEPDLRVTRDLQEVDDTGAITGRTVTKRTVTVRLSNLGPRPRTVEVTERVPVSELDEVTVEVDRKATAPPAEADRDGFVRWPVDLAPHGHAELRLTYRITRTRKVATA